MRVQELIARREALTQERRTWEKDWTELAQHFLPRKMRSLELNGEQTNKGGLRRDILNNSGILAMRDLAAGMHGGMTSPARPWFRLSLQDEEMASYKPVRAWLDECQDRMRTLFHRSNFYNVIHSLYSELGTFGTGYMFELEDPRTGIRFVPLTVGEYDLDTDEHGRVDTIFRTCDMTVRQIVRRFGYEQCPDIIKRLFDSPPNTTIDRFKVVHAVMPRNDREPRREDSRHMPWASYYYLEGRDGTRQGSGLAEPFLLSEGGYREFPGFGPRWDVTGYDVYGRSPGMDVLGDVLQIQQMTRSMLKALHKEVDPPMASPAGTKGLSLLPGAENFYDIGQQVGGQPIYPLLNIRPNIQNTAGAIKDVEDRIKRGLYNDLFKMLMGSDRRQITAREVAAREEEKLILLGPVLERLHDELFIPLVDRTWNLMQEQNMLPEPPEDVQGLDIKVEFVSLLAQAQKMVATSAVDQYALFVANMAPLIPEMLDSIDPDKMADGYAGYLGLETDMLRAQEDRDRVREQRAKAIQQQQAAEQVASMGPMAGAMKAMSETPVQQEQPNALDTLMGSFGGGA